MTLDETIKHLENAGQPEDHKQLALWLKELKQLRGNESTELPRACMICHSYDYCKTNNKEYCLNRFQ